MSFQVEFPGRHGARHRTWLDRAVAALLDDRRWHDVATWAVVLATVAYVVLYLAGVLPRGCAR